MANRIVARWRDWSGNSIEHLVLNEGSSVIVADATILGSAGDNFFAVGYRIRCDRAWRVRKVEISEIGSDHQTELESDGAGKWMDGSGTALPRLSGAIDVDISITPFTNTLPIRRLKLRRGESAEILAVYLQLPGLDIATDRQRYTCLEYARRYRYESLESDFTREIEVDDNGLVVTYPGLFRRVL
jgi:hypothetical protein